MAAQRKCCALLPSNKRSAGLFLPDWCRLLSERGQEF